MLTFQTLLKYFPHTLHPCRDGFTDQCAIRLSIALECVEPQFFDGYPIWPGARCSHGHARSASRLAHYLERKLGVSQKPKSRSTIQGNGILYYSRHPATNHIDLWASNLCLSNLVLTTDPQRRQEWQNMTRRNQGNWLRTMSWTSGTHNELWFWPLP
jgi:hypothetical protein